MDKLSIKDVQFGTVNCFDMISLCLEINAKESCYGLIARTDLQFRSPKQTASEWYSLFGYEMPPIIRITKVTNAKAHDCSKDEFKRLNFFFGISKSFEWVVPNMIMRNINNGEIRVCVTYYDNDNTSFRDFFVVENHFATSEELDFINSHLYTPQKKSAEPSILPKGKLYKQSSIIKLNYSDIIDAIMI